MPDKPTIYRITHLWPNKQPGQGLTAQIEEDRERSWRIHECVRCGYKGLQPPVIGSSASCRQGHDVIATPVVPAPDKEDATVQIKPETDEPNALPSRFVSLQDYERLERAGHRVLILDDAEPGEVSEAHVAVIGELRAALSSEATKGDK